jgi:hypothetical protein
VKALISRYIGTISFNGDAPCAAEALKREGWRVDIVLEGGAIANQVSLSEVEQSELNQLTA